MFEAVARILGKTMVKQADHLYRDHMYRVFNSDFGEGGERSPPYGEGDSRHNRTRHADFNPPGHMYNIEQIR